MIKYVFRKKNKAFGKTVFYKITFRLETLKEFLSLKKWFKIVSGIKFI